MTEIGSAWDRVLKKAGIKAPGLDQAIKKNSQLVRFYVGKGSIPYGDHPPGKDLHDDNGKNGSAAVLFDLLGDKKAAEYFTRTSVACHGGARDQGHTGNYFNLLWAMPGVSRSGPHATGAWLKEFGWHNDLARSFNGELVFLGQAIPKRTVFHGWQSTGFYMLGYAMPLKKLYLTGKKDSAAPQISIQEASQLISDGKGWSRKNGAYGYHKRSTAELMKGLESWSPIVRNHSASTLKARKDVSIQKLIKLLKSDSVYTQLGACEAIKRKRNEASAAVPQLQKLLFSEDLWVRIKAAEALAAIGSKAFDTLPTLLKMMANPATEKDPRNMQQRYLTIALFSPGSGMVRKAIKEVDKKLMYKAIRAGLKNEDGWARREISTVYDHLTFNEIKPILPQIFEAIKTPAPSGIMFADKSRLDGLKLLAKHNIKEGLPWAVKLLKSERWGFGNRAKAALNVIKTYGANAQPHVPELEKFVIHLNKVKGWDDTKIDTLKIREVIDSVKKSNKKPKLISLEGIK